MKAVGSRQKAEGSQKHGLPWLPSAYCFLPSTILPSCSRRVSAKMPAVFFKHSVSLPLFFDFAAGRSGSHLFRLRRQIYE
jgi:hypothetical protein